jgi:hypothetical protein
MRPVTVLDVGSGPERLTEMFLGTDFAVTRCDIESFGQDDVVVVAPGRRLPFDEGAFDAVVALEVLEHVEPEERGQLVRECLRVARDVAVISCPDGRTEVAAAERQIAGAFELLTGREHPFLSEHAARGLPPEASVRQLFDAAGIEPLVVGNSPLDRWYAFLMLDQVLRTLERGPEIAAAIYRRANTSWPGLPARDPYRRFYVGPKNERVATAIREAILEPSGEAAPDLADPVFQLARLAGAELSERDVAHVRAEAQRLDVEHRWKVEARRTAELKKQIEEVRNVESGLRADLAATRNEARAWETQVADAKANVDRLTAELELFSSTLAAVTADTRAQRTRIVTAVRALAARPWSNQPYGAEPSGAVANTQSADHSLWCFTGAGSLRLSSSLGPGDYRILAYALSSLSTDLKIDVGPEVVRVPIQPHKSKQVRIDVSLASAGDAVEIRFDPVAPSAVLVDLQILRRVDEPVTRTLRRNVIAIARRRRSLLTIAQTRAGRAVARRLRPPPPPLPPEASDYERWTHQRVLDRAASLPRPAPRAKLSLLTTVWNTPGVYLEALGASVLGQSYPNFEWILLDNGSTDLETISRCIRFGGDDRVLFERSSDNLGIIGGVRRCLERASGRYVLPVDSDDVLYPDALHVVASALSGARFPSLAYTDEDKIFDDRVVDAYLKPDWDPVLFLNSCYIAHLCAIDRERALELGAYTDEAAEGCHDWDTFIRFMLAGDVPLHIDEVLYSWRMHPESAALNIASKPYLDASHRHVLQKFLDSVPRPDLYRIVRSPLWGPTPDWWFRRERVDPRPVMMIRFATSEVVGTRKAEGMIALDAPVASLRLPAERALSDGALLHLIWDRVDVEGEDGLWDAIALFELHSDTVMVGGRVFDDSRRVVAAGEYFGFGGVCGCPDVGRNERDPGYFGQMWKQRSVSAVSSMLAVVDPVFLLRSLDDIDEESASLPFLGTWLGACAAGEGRRIVFTPFLIGRTSGTRQEWDALVSGRERAAFLEKYGAAVVPETRYLSRWLSLDPASAYTPASPEEREQTLARTRAVPREEAFAARPA